MPEAEHIYFNEICELCRDEEKFKEDLRKASKKKIKNKNIDNSKKRD